MRKTLALLSGLMLVASFAAYGDTYNEAPMLAALVSAGSLPPVDDRLPDVPQVVEPQASLGQSIGEYGGTANVLHLRPDRTRDGWYLAGTDPFLRIDFDQSTIVTNMPERYELSGDGMTFTFKLRAGMKWSDGEPFGLHDIEFWHTDILQNESLTPSVPGGFAPGGEVMRYEAVDETTARLHFSAPHPLFTTLLVGGWGGVLTPPSHYLKQFHIAHNSDADKVAKEAGFDAWHQYFNDRNHHFIGFPMKPDLPTLNPYTQTRKETDLLVYERNPFYWKVDSAGNQLPYIDRIVSRRLEDLQVYYGKIISGEVDFAAAEGHTVNFQEFPMFKENEAAGQYRVLLWQYTNQSSPTLMLNQTLEGDEVLRDLFREVNFRRALSLAIDRHEINEVLYFGRAKPTQINALSTSKYYNPDYDDSWAQFDPDRANQMLDELGLEWDRNREFRLRPDGKRLAWTFLTQSIQPALEELIKEYWAAVGVDLSINVLNIELYRERVRANDLQMGAWGHDGSSDFLIFNDPYNLVPTPSTGNAWSQLWAKWLDSGGDQGEEPPADVVQMYDNWQQLQATVDEAEGVRLGKEILTWVSENLPVIGTVGYFPTVFIIKDNLMNVPETYLYGWDMLYTFPAHPELFYLQQPLQPHQM